ncbi:trypsin-like serine peptidase [Paramylibacter ulvae]|nr:trypsin-like serine protease [Amylibacter ulvae]
MIKRILMILGLALAGVSAHADDAAPLRQLLSPTDANKWQAVGLLIMDGHATCTGTLIAPNQVLTAAHCMFLNDTKKRYDTSAIKFLPGWRLGRATSYRTARRVVIHKDYRNMEYDGRTRRDLVATDLAIIELDRSISKDVVKPFAVHDQPKVGAELTVVSYGKGRNDAPSIEEGCHVMGKDDRVLQATCSVDFGASGAPIFVMDNGVPKIASVVSAKGETNFGQPLSFGVALGEPLDQLRSQLKFDRSVFQGKKAGKSLSEQLGR